jgi:Ser/Thr protein kinase RdoA (MazF antagonist)
MEISYILSLLKENYKIQFDKIELFREAGSRSYIVFGNDKKYFLKIIRSVFIDTALQSVDIHLYLIKNNIPVPMIILTNQSKPYVESNESDGRHLYILYEFIEGKEPSKNEEAENIGCLIGKYHKVMENYKGDLLKRDKYYFIDRYIEILRKMNYPEPKVTAFKKHGDALWERVKDLPPGYCHGDLYIGNIHQSLTGELYVLDFDTSCYAFPLYDIALVCNSTNYFDFDESGYEKTKKVLEAFLKGYEQFCPLTDIEREAIFSFIAIYHYQLQATIIEINGLDCVDKEFLDNQYNWLIKWANQCGYKS